ncbi:uncharacterized protein LOC124290661 [Haliotis rubra]|uniref:uncharacterized protein LOC124290661 n=1 Tax=Haliotis rubra TaxID=36100 RepID=UPI001EE5C189|nr:uncharacterized protein LOC124290661 [Haliotis rubra]
MVAQGLDSEDLSAVPSTSTSSNNLNVHSARTSPILLSCTLPRQAAPPTPHDPPASFQLSPVIVSRPGSKKQKTKVHTHEDSAAQAAEVVQLEREKVAIMRERLQIDRERLQVEKEILNELRLMRKQADQNVTPMCISPIITFDS